MNTIKRLVIAALSVLFISSAMSAQDESTSTLRRTTAADRNKAAQSAGATVSDRLQIHYDDSGASITDADRQWMRVIYRQIDLDQDVNAALYYPEEAIDGQENLFRIIMRLLANNQLTAYEYLDGRELFTDQYKLKVSDLLDRFHIIYTQAKGSTEKNPKYVIDESDVPTNEVLSYYVIERWEFDTRGNRMKTYVDAICPVLHRSGDFGGEAVKYPMFWVKYSDLRPWLAQQTIFTSDDNNLPTCTYDDFFNLTMYKGDIYKTRNLRNKSMMQMYPDTADLHRAQDSIQQRLDKFEEKLWVPDREKVIAAKTKSTDKVESSSKSDKDDIEAAINEAVEAEKATKSSKRSTARSAKKSSSSKTSSTKVKTQKASTSSSATKSVRRRK
jgi:gliding motility associated protien GldN